MAWEIVDVDGFTSTRISNIYSGWSAVTNSYGNIWSGGDVVTSVGTNIIQTTGGGYPNYTWVNLLDQSPVKIDYCGYESSTSWGIEHSGGYRLSVNSQVRSNQTRGLGVEGYHFNEYALNGLIILIDRDTELGLLAVISRYYSVPSGPVGVIISRLSGYEFEARAIYQWATNYAPIVWKCWTSLLGNNGRYRASLTKIKESSIGDFSAQISGNASDMDYIAYQVDMIQFVSNMSYNVEETIAWSGANRLTMEVLSVQGNPNKAQLMFRFYAHTSSETTPIFSFATEVTVSGSYPDKHLYLAFAYNDERQIALFVPIRHTSTDSYIWGYNASSISDNNKLYVWQWLQFSAAGEDDRPDNPYDGGTPDNGGTDGIIQPPDEVNPGQLPTLDATTKGLFTVYLPTETQLGDIASFMWSDDVLDNFKKYFNNFNQNIIALYVLPYAPTNPPTKPFKVGRIESDTITAVGYLNQRFVSIDMGSFTVKPRWGSYLDYAPYTKFEIYLPGIGMQVLDTDDIMSVTDKDGNVSATSGSIISLEYHVDLLTGVCVAYVKINNDVKYQFPGKLGYTIPITGEDYGRMITAFATVAAGVAGGIAYGGISAPLKNPAIGHMVGSEVSAAVAGTVNAMKPEVHRSGNLSCEASALSTDTPYLIRSMPNKPELVNQQVFTGFPSYKSGVLSEFDGYTECIDAHVEGISCTEEERKMLIEWLRKGVIL